MTQTGFDWAGCRPEVPHRAGARLDRAAGPAGRLVSRTARVGPGHTST